MRSRRKLGNPCEVASGAVTVSILDCFYQIGSNAGLMTISNNAIEVVGMSWDQLLNSLLSCI